MKIAQEKKQTKVSLHYAHKRKSSTILVNTSWQLYIIYHDQMKFYPQDTSWFSIQINQHNSPYFQIKQTKTIQKFNDPEKKHLKKSNIHSWILNFSTLRTEDFFNLMKCIYKQTKTTKKRLHLASIAPNSERMSARPLTSWTNKTKMSSLTTST